LNHELEPTAIMESDRSEVTRVARRQSTNAQRLGQRHHRCVDEAQTEVAEAPVNFHGTRELPQRRRRIREGATGEILHERLHRLALIPKEVVDLGEHEAWNVSRTRLVDGVAKASVVWRAVNEVVDKRPGVTDDRRRATGRHGTARVRSRAQLACQRAVEVVIGQQIDVVVPHVLGPPAASMPLNGRTVVGR